MVTNTDLYYRYEEADSYAQEPGLDEEFVRRFSAIEQKLERLWHRDTAEWVSRYYRQEYRRWKKDERSKPPCECGNPRCPLLDGAVPYQLRRRKTSLDTVDETPIEKLRSYLKTHPDALVIEEALDELRDLRSEVSDELVQYIRDARRVVEGDENGDVDILDPSPSLPMAEGVRSSPDVSPPSGGDV